MTQVFFLGNSSSEKRLYNLFEDSFFKFSREWCSKNPRTGFFANFCDNDSVVTGRLGKDDLQRAWHSHLRSLGMRPTHLMSSEGDNVYVVDPSNATGTVQRIFIELGRIEATKILALDYIP